MQFSKKDFPTEFIKKKHQNQMTNKLSMYKLQKHPLLHQGSLQFLGSFLQNDPLIGLLMGHKNLNTERDVLKACRIFLHPIVMGFFFYLL
jgi:hypothetical protein